MRCKERLEFQIAFSKEQYCGASEFIPTVRANLHPT